MPDRDADLEAHFPNLRTTGYRVTSETAYAPNCIGWALHDMHNFWDPHATGMPGIYWPPGVPSDDSVGTWIQLFRLFSFELCDGAELEENFEKVAIYARVAEEAEHVARQLPSGAWTSKLGSGRDIEHQSVDALSQSEYGEVMAVMRRRRRP